MNVVITGGTGFIGASLVSDLVRNGHRITVLSRNPGHMSSESGSKKPNPLSLPWDGKTLGPWADQVDGTDAIINLAGEPIGAHRWTQDRKRRIVESRLHATRIIVEAIHKAGHKPGTLISGSAVGYYGDVGEGIVTEDHPGARDFLGTLCTQWEQEALKADQDGVRVVLLRTGIVLEKDGGALAKMLTPYKFFAGGPLGSGRQWMPWIHREDEIGIIRFALEHTAVSGSVNVTAPEPVRMKKFAAILGNVLHRPAWAPVPSFVLKGVLGEMSGMVLTGQQAVPEKILSAGYTFAYPGLAGALHTIFHHKS